jgi:hypothetical protein
MEFYDDHAAGSDPDCGRLDHSYPALRKAIIALSVKNASLSLLRMGMSTKGQALNATNN